MLQVFDADEEYLVGARGHVLVTVWGRVTLDRLRRATAAYRWVLEETDLEDKMFGMIAILIPQRLAIPDTLDAETHKLDEFMAPHVLARAIVIEGDGVRSSLLRNTVKATSVLRPRKYPEKHFGEVSEAARWILPQITARTGESFLIEDLAWDIAEARALHHHSG